MRGDRALPNLWLGAGGATGEEWGAGMTYEMAVARAFLQALGREPWSTARGSLTTRTYALRRLRVRAGLVP